jgi:TIGR00266 family protein
VNISIDHDPAYAVAQISLNPEEQVTSEAGALVSHTAGIEIQTQSGDTDEGLLESVKDSVLGDESFFRNVYTASDSGGTVTLAPSLPGDLHTFGLQGDTLYVQQTGYVAAGIDVDIDSEFGGLDTVLGGEGISVLKTQGTGPLVVSAFGGINNVSLNPGETYTVDSGHAVAWDESMEYDTRRVGGLKSTLFSGEGFVIDFTGPGNIYFQTRDYERFVSDIVSRVPSNGDDGVNVDMGGAGTGGFVGDQP